MENEIAPEKNKRISMSLKSYMKPTPILMRKIGDGLLAVSTMVTGSAIVTDHKWIALTSLVVGAIGKFISNLFSDE